METLSFNPMTEQREFVYDNKQYAIRNVRRKSKEISHNNSASKSVDDHYEVALIDDDIRKTRQGRKAIIFAFMTGLPLACLAFFQMVSLGNSFAANLLSDYEPKSADFVESLYPSLFSGVFNFVIPLVAAIGILYVWSDLFKIVYENITGNELSLDETSTELKWQSLHKLTALSDKTIMFDLSTIEKMQESDLAKIYDLLVEKDNLEQEREKFTKAKSESAGASKFDKELEKTISELNTSVADVDTKLSAMVNELALKVDAIEEQENQKKLEKLDDEIADMLYKRNESA